MSTVQFISKLEVQRFIPTRPAHLLSISDGEDDQAIVNCECWESVEFHHFVDGDFDEEKIKMFGNQFEHLFRDYFLSRKADRLRASIERLVATGADIVVNCQAGRSRSAAVSLFINETYGYSLNQDTPGANQTVLRMLRRDSLLLAAYRESLTPPPVISEASPGAVKKLLGLLRLWRPAGH
ncbi:dual specificity protein phosphatase family protein [Pseudomonas sp. Irchel 3E13]|uniref:dual specificity protein phosphatase family protein n=1 Tax=Pseudomonas sp. Irchel 3E13 TaxID=2008975 RepID=UPI000BA2EB4B|nr:dual specificity protein phosphatase family protein [Pseudomonas sp. Irchel 3E13]